MTSEEQATVVLRRARQHLQRGWCQRYHAIDAEGKPVSPSSAGVVATCARGALWRALYEMHDSREVRAGLIMIAEQRLVRSLPVRGGVSLAFYNDRRIKTVEPLLNVFDRAIGGK